MATFQVALCDIPLLPAVPGLSVGVCGSIPELGEWDYAKGVALTGVEEGTYKGTIELEEPQPFEYKFFVRWGDKIVWELGENRQFNSENTADVQACSWNCPHPFSILDAGKVNNIWSADTGQAAATKQLKFVVAAPSLPPASTLSIVGSCPDLGEWDTANSLQLTPQDGVWVGAMPLPLDGAFSFKLVATTASAAASAAAAASASAEQKAAEQVWEEGDNRALDLPFLLAALGSSPMLPLLGAGADGSSGGAAADGVGDGDGEAKEGASAAAGGILPVNRVGATWWLPGEALLQGCGSGAGGAPCLRLVWHGRDPAMDLPAAVTTDEYLIPFAPAVQNRLARFRDAKQRIERDGGGGGLLPFSTSYTQYGLLRGDGGIQYTEWAPAASRLSLIGDFNDWDPEAHICERNEFGVWSLWLPDGAEDGAPAIAHGSKVKACVLDAQGQRADKIPAWIAYAVQDPETYAFSGVFWNPPPEEKYTWRFPRSSARATSGDDFSLRIYECHVGMSGGPKVTSYREAARDLLPRVKALGFTAIQFMAVQEHAYYASFGYHVTNFFAPSSRCGSPEDLKFLVDSAHALGLLVIMDAVHSHASKNTLDGLNRFDGSGHCYFHDGPRGDHDLWDSKLFNYGSLEVQRFLLSNLRWYVEEYRFDGFRFDGVTSMLYRHHGLGVGFSGGYPEYFGDGVDEEAVCYLQLANDMLHSLSPPVLTIAEDVSGMPTLGRPVWEGGIGFDYRLAMAIPDQWIKLLKESSDEGWGMGHIVHTLTNRRCTEKHIAYAESHDQALVGDKTLAFRLMDSEMYTGMSLTQPASPVIDRGVALHKLIRLICSALGGEGYLTFMGNEFGHPEWIDFPREGNNNSYQHCRRQWNLVDDPLLRYAHMNNFEKAMHALEDSYHWLSSSDVGQYVSSAHEQDKMVVFEKAGLVWVFNFHPSQSFTDYRVGAPTAGDYRVVLSSDDAEFGGYSRVDPATIATSVAEPHNNRPCSFHVYSPSRTAVVYAPVAC